MFRMSADSGVTGRRRLAFGVAVLTSGLAAWGLFLFFTGDADGPYSGLTCYYNGRYRGDCPEVRTGPSVDTVLVYGAVIDSLYFARVAATSLVSDVVAIVDETSLGDQDVSDLTEVKSLLAKAAPDAPQSLVTSFQSVNVTQKSLGPMWTVAERQLFLDSAAVRSAFERAGAGGALGGRDTVRLLPDEILPPGGLLTLSRVGFDPYHRWALVYITTRDSERRGAG
ncbi:MAG: hypothetical protein ABR543_08395, partial [Gemmatimonadaceae bacterium]